VNSGEQEPFVWRLTQKLTHFFGQRARSLGWSVEAIKTFLESVNGVAVDVRMVPRSRYAPFNGTAFSRLLRDRYYWLSDFGNVNYKSNGPIAIADFDKGVERLGPLRTAGKAVVLLCGCADINTCHRKILAERLAQRWGAEVVHLTPPPKTAKPEPSGRSKLF
jgi:uncharacterized protein (DUF488 family)